MPGAVERIQEVLQPTAAGKPRVGLDTCCVQYYISNPPAQPWADCLDPVFGAALEGKIELYISTVVVAELLAQVHFKNRHNAGYDPELDLLAIMNRHFQVLNVDSLVARAGGRLRGSYFPGDKIALKTPDALIGGTSVANGHTLFITNDAQLANALPSTNCVYLREIALDWLARRFPVPCFEKTAIVRPSTKGKGLPTRASIRTMELGGLRPEAGATWRRILKDAQMIASTLNEPCIFFVLSEKNGRKTEAVEVLFWHEGLTESRQPVRLIKRLYDHLGYSAKTGIANAKGNHVHGLVCTSLALENARQMIPGFASKSDHQKASSAWDAYLSVFRSFCRSFELPQCTWLLYEGATTHVLDAHATLSFLDRAKNVLGWSSET